MSSPVTIQPFDGKSVCLFCGSSETVLPEYLDAARAFGEATANAGWRLVYGGGGVGLMGASARAAHAAGGRVLGVMPGFLRSRERLFDEGTLEEAIEVLSWKRLDLHAKPVIFLNLNGFWDALLAVMDHSIEEGMTPESFRQAWTVCNTVAETIEAVRAAEDVPHLQHDQR